MDFYGIPDVFSSIVCITEHVRLLYLYLLFPGTEGIVTSSVQVDWRATNYKGVSGQKNDKIVIQLKLSQEGTMIINQSISVLHL